MIVDDHYIVRKGILQVLELEENFQVVAEAENGTECLKILEKTCPDLMLLDVRMPGISGLALIHLIRQKCPATKIIMLTIFDDHKIVAEAIKAGIKAYVLKSIGGEELIDVINKVIKNQDFLDPALATFFFDKIRSEPLEVHDQLTKREMEIINQLSSGKSSAEISESLFVSVHTVRSHIKNIYRKLNVSSKSQAIAEAKKKRIIM